MMGKVLIIIGLLVCGIIIGLMFHQEPVQEGCGCNYIVPICKGELVGENVTLKHGVNYCWIEICGDYEKIDGDKK